MSRPRLVTHNLFYLGTEVKVADFILPRGPSRAANHNDEVLSADFIPNYVSC
jgi:hypothetical protein